jgi:hypothetical protein
LATSLNDSRRKRAVKAVMIVAILVAIGGLTDAIDTDDVAEHRFDQIAALISAIVFTVAYFVERERRGNQGG